MPIIKKYYIISDSEKNSYVQRCPTAIGYGPNGEVLLLKLVKDLSKATLMSKKEVNKNFNRIFERDYVLEDGTKPNFSSLEIKTVKVTYQILN